MHFFDRSQVLELLDMPGCIDLMRDTLVDYSTGKRWHNDFIRCVGAFYGLLPMDDRTENEKNLEFPKS